MHKRSRREEKRTTPVFCFVAVLDSEAVLSMRDCVEDWKNAPLQERISFFSHFSFNIRYPSITTTKHLEDIKKEQKAEQTKCQNASAREFLRFLDEKSLSRSPDPLKQK